MPVTYIFTLSGRVNSNKNSRQIWFNKKTKRVVLAHSNSYNNFRESALFQLNLQKARMKLSEPIAAPYQVNIIFCMRGEAGTDKDNMEATIYDILQDAGIITNDKQIYIGKEVKIPHCDDYNTTIFISTKAAPKAADFLTISKEMQL